MKRGSALLLSLACACGGNSGQDGQALAGAKTRARGALLAQVNGAAIGVDQVRELSLSTGLAPHVALTRLEEEELLAREAVRRGYGRTNATKEDVKRALVQALLKETLETLRPEDVPFSEVRARFDSVAGQNQIPADSFDKYEGAVREQLVLEKQKVALEKLSSELSARFGVRLSEPEVQKLLSDAAFWGES